MTYEIATDKTLGGGNVLPIEVETTHVGNDVYGDACPDPSLIVRYLIGDPEAIKDFDLEQHLKTCPDCRLELDALRQAISNIHK